MHAPTTAHLKMVQRILQYVKGTINNGLHFTIKLHLSAFSDIDWVGCLTTRCSTTGYSVSYLVVISSPGVLRNNTPFRALALKQNIAL